MSITLRTTVEVEMKLVISTVAVAELAAERAKARVMMADPKAKEMNPRQKLLVDVLTGDLSDEETFKVLFRHGFREWFRDTAPGEFSQTGITVRTAPAKVSFKDRKAVS